jgi:hypothetical protein
MPAGDGPSRPTAPVALHWCPPAPARRPRPEAALALRPRQRRSQPGHTLQRLRQQAPGADLATDLETLREIGRRLPVLAPRLHHAPQARWRPGDAPAVAYLPVARQRLLLQGRCPFVLTAPVSRPAQKGERRGVMGSEGPRGCFQRTGRPRMFIYGVRLLFAKERS